MQASRREIVYGVVTLLVFAGILVFWFHSPFYLEKKAMEREAAISWLVLNPPDSIEVMSVAPYDRQTFIDYRRGLMERYDITEDELKLSVEETPRQELMNKNPAVKFLLGYH